MNITNWSNTKRIRLALTLALLLLVSAFLYQARAALLPFFVGAILAYVLLPLINWLDRNMRIIIRGERITRSLAVLIAYSLSILIIVGLLTFAIPLIVTQLNVLGQALPGLARRVYSAAPEVVQLWLDRYNRTVPEEIRLALERSVQDTLQSLLAALQAGAFKTVSVLFSTVSFVLGLLIVPLWMFYFMRDQPEIDAALYRVVPLAYREDVRSVRALVDAVLSAYLRGQIILSFAVGIMSTLGLELLGIDFALLLGTISGLLEVVPVIGPILAAIPMILVALATSPSKLLWVILLAFAVQQIENYVLVPQITHGTVKLHPAMAMIVLVVGSAVGGILGVLLSIPLAAITRDIVRYTYLRLADEPLPPQEALARVRPGL
jgi:predicted PurR-regulated permease PerM